MGGMTAMGVRFKDDAECVGVLLPVDDDDLKHFDKREKGYDRVPLYLGDVEPVPFLDDKHYDDEGHEVFLNAKEMKVDVKIWMYIQHDLAPPSDDAPIAQSYLDTILRGCLSISDDFAEQMIETTKGWTPAEIEDDESSMEETGGSCSGDSVNSTSSSEVYWVNDRHNPIYSRCDQDYMLKHGHKIDRLLQRYRDEFQFRERHVPHASE
jgi:hypothetical protein